MAQSLFTSQTPSSGNNSDLGAAGGTTATAIQVAVAGTITHVRFFATTTVGGTYTAELWIPLDGDSTGTYPSAPASTATMGGAPSAATWNTVALPSGGVHVAAGTVVRPALWSSAGRYVATAGFFAAPLVNGDLTGLQDGTAFVNGSLNDGTFFLNGAAGNYPRQSGGGAATSFFLDIVFEPDPTNIDATLDLTAPAATLSMDATVTDAATLTLSAAPATLSMNATVTDSATLDLTAPAATLSMDATVDTSITGVLTVTAPAAVLSINADSGVSTDTLLFPQAQALLDCLCQALEDNASTLFPAPEICCLRAGEGVALDITNAGVDECCKGLAFVRIDNFYPTGGPDAPFPSPSSDFALNKCSPYAWGLQMEMGVYRCLGEPDCAQWTFIAQRQMLDAKSMRQALCCFMADLPTGSVALTPWQSKGPEGGCVGGTMNITVMVKNCGGC